MKENKIGKGILAAGFAVLLILVWTGSDSLTGLYGIGNYLQQQIQAGMQDYGWTAEQTPGEVQESGDDMEMIKTAYTDSLWQKQNLINLNGLMARSLDIRGQYSDIGMYVLDGSYVVTAYPEASTDYEVEQTIKLKKYLDQRGINLLYVNQPEKYLDDSLLAEKFGVETYSNRNADLFLKRIREAGIAAIDLREALKAEGMNISDMFYRTDHHWTTESGFWAAKKIAQGLNEYCGYHIDLSLYDVDKFTFELWEDCWLGEQGRKIAQTYVGLDDFTLIKPKYETDISIFENGSYKKGSFDDMVDESYYVTEEDPSQALSWYYSYKIRKTRNEKIKNGRVLVLLDSYSHVTMPYLALSVGEIDFRMLRNMEYNLSEIIENDNYDTVIIAYAQFMIGAHNNTDSANYRMFTFFEQNEK